MIIVIFLALFSVPAYFAYAVWFNPDYKDYVWIDRGMILLSAAYSVASFSSIVYVAPTVLWRMKKPARDLAREITKEAQVEFDKDRKNRRWFRPSRW